MISRTAQRRNRRKRMGEAMFRRMHNRFKYGHGARYIARVKLPAINATLANGTKVTRDPVTKQFVSLKKLRDSFVNRLRRFARRTGVDLRPATA